MRISDWSSDVCSSDLLAAQVANHRQDGVAGTIQVGRLGAAHDQVHTVAARRAVIGIGADVGLREAVLDLAERPGEDTLDQPRTEIGRASCRERVWQFGLITVVAVTLKKKKDKP